MLLWGVIAILVIGGSIGGYLLAHKIDELSQENTDLTNRNAGLSLQLQAAQASATPEPSASPSASATPAATATPKASTTPAATPTPTPTPKKSGSGSNL